MSFNCSSLNQNHSFQGEMIGVAQLTVLHWKRICLYSFFLAFLFEILESLKYDTDFVRTRARQSCSAKIGPLYEMNRCLFLPTFRNFRFAHQKIFRNGYGEGILAFEAYIIIHNSVYHISCIVSRESRQDLYCQANTQQLEKVKTFS